MPAIIDSHAHPGMVALLNSEGGEHGLPSESKEALFDFLRQFARENPGLPFVTLGP